MGNAEYMGSQSQSTAKVTAESAENFPAILQVLAVIGRAVPSSDRVTSVT